MKKIISLVIVCILAAAMCLPTFATPRSQDMTGASSLTAVRRTAADSAVFALITAKNFTSDSLRYA